MADTVTSTLHVELVAADRTVWSGEAAMVIARTHDGDIGVLRGHAPTLSLLSAGASCAIAAWAAPISDSADVPTKNLASQCLCEACIP